MSAGPDDRAATRGFTLIELVVTMAMIAIMLALAAPNFVTFQRDSQLTSAANSFIASMATARAEAMKRNHDAYVMPGTTADPTCKSSWTCGWIVFVDMDKSGSYTAGDVLVSEQEKPPTAISTPSSSAVNQFSDGSSIYVLYNGSGFPRLKSGNFAASSLDFAYGTATDGSTTRRVISSVTGRMWVCKPVATATGCVQGN